MALTSNPAVSPSTVRGQFASTVIANIPLCREHYRLVLRAPSFPPTRPGQFIQISCRDAADNHNPELEFDWPTDGEVISVAQEFENPLAFLRRPFSLAGREDSHAGVDLQIIHRVVGVGTDWMANVKIGDRVDILGPLGNWFTLPDDDGLAVLVGGGVGIPPMLYLAEALANRRAVAFCGALTRDLLPLTLRAEAKGFSQDGFEPAPGIDEFARHGIPSVITTDDGTLGFRGLVTQALERYLDSVSHLKNKIIIYTCGPEPMMKRVGEIAASRGIRSQIAVERAMACGMGTCQSCCIRVKKKDPAAAPLPGKDWCYRLACTDGPVFWGSDLLW
jgi:dihydroorotate dehydrogenase electron transfer subunit